MTIDELTKLVQNLIETYRTEIGERPKVTPVKWKGISMTVEEAKIIIQELERRKLEAQKWMKNTQNGGEITKVATSGAGTAAIVTGLILTLFPPTTLAGIATLAAGAGAASIGNTVGDNVSKIGKNNGEQEIEQYDAYINSIKDAIINSI